MGIRLFPWLVDPPNIVIPLPLWFFAATNAGSYECFAISVIPSGMVFGLTISPLILVTVCIM